MTESAADTRVMPVESIVRSHSFIADAHAFRSPAFRSELFERWVPALKEVEAKIRVFEFAIKALPVNTASGRDAMAALKRLRDEGVLAVLNDAPMGSGSMMDDQAAQIEALVNRVHLKHKLAVVTNNPRLADRVRSVSRAAAFKHAKPVILFAVCGNEVLQISEDDDLRELQVNWATKSSQRFMAHALGNCVVVVDTCSILLRAFKDQEPVGLRFLESTLIPAIEKGECRAVIPQRVITELNKKSGSEDDPALADTASKALALVNSLVNRRLIKTPHQDNDLIGPSGFADPVFLNVAQQFQMDAGLAFITQDKELARVLLDARHPSNAMPYWVSFIPQAGDSIVPWERKLANADAKAAEERKSVAVAPPVQSADSKPNAEAATDRTATAAPPAETVSASPSQKGSLPQQQAKSHKHKGKQYRPKSSPAEKKRAEPFPLAKTPNEPIGMIKVSALPGVGATINAAKGGSFVLTELIAAGGEGSVYRTNLPGQVCKIYHQDKLTIARYEKLRLMLSREVSIRGVCWPTDLAQVADGTFVGYLMPEVRGKILRTSVWGKKLLERHHPGFTRLHLVKLCETIADAIRQLHELNIFIGDINPMNVLIVDENEIYIVDADSFQVGPYPCPVGTEPYTPARLQGKSFGSFLRTHDDEMFAVTILLFEILLPGKHPYSAQEGGTVTENILNNEFPYARDNDSRPPRGAYQFIWTHLGNRLQRDFEAVFAKNERVSAGALLSHLRATRKEIEQGTLSDVIFPTEPRIHGQTYTLYCSRCPPGSPPHNVSERLYQQRLEMGPDGLSKWSCKSCLDAAALHRTTNSRLTNCALRVSPNCTLQENVSFDHLTQLQERGHEFRCRPCREHDYRARQIAHQQRQQQWQQQRRQKASPCFVATAAFGDPHAEPVRWLRLYRDDVLMRSLAGRIFIDLYYRGGGMIAAPVRRVPPLRRAARRLLTRLIAHLQSKHPHIQIPENKD